MQMNPDVSSRVVNGMHTRYRAEIDGLRALAVLPVLLYHAGLELFSGGFVGVDVFFVISGYLITSNILREQSRGEFSLTRFYMRRMRRILPALFFVILCSVPIACFLLAPAELDAFGHSIVYVVIFLSNVYFQRSTDYFSPDAESQPLLHTWSLGVEEQYYLIFPLAVLVLWRFGRGGVLWSIVAVTLCSFVYCEWASRHHPIENFYGLGSRAWELLFGAMLAFIPPDNTVITRLRSRRGGDDLAGLGIALIVFGILALSDTLRLPSAFTLLPVLGAALVIVFASPDGRYGRLLCLGPVVGIGLVSYSLYLWHQPLIAFSYSVASTSAYAALLACVVSVACAYLTWRFVEVPFRTSSVQFRPVVLAAAALVAFAAVLTGPGLPRGARNAPSHAVRTNVPTFMSAFSGCHLPVRDKLDTLPICAVGSAGSPPGYILWGDSHAGALSMGLGASLGATARSAIQFTKGGCPPVLGVVNRRWGEDHDCAGFSNAVLEFVNGSNRPLTIMMFAHWADIVENPNYEIVPSIADSARTAQSRGFAEQLAENLRATAKLLIEAGHHVVLVYPAPRFPHNVPKYVSEQLDSAAVYRLPRAHVEDSLAPAVAMLDRAIQAMPVARVHPIEAFCDSDYCFAGDKLHLWFQDKHHVTYEGAMRILNANAEILFEKSSAWVIDK